jgi:hypothetical protein
MEKDEQYYIDLIKEIKKKRDRLKKWKIPAPIKKGQTIKQEQIVVTVTIKVN